ncbi:hypothetical protein BHYA_0222g00070 [Botrytis hyacinthi]|uniref:Uncharacterized protein n=1 Tax=Botrytis hyacinthi TaxID=278943 RepID=A0A4Z1GJD8_9HELO|nr:hypothetical protein BHYA_0222g00070 [Botrytis hyacinthi]
MEYSYQGVLPLLRTYFADHIGGKAGLCHPARLSQQAIMIRFYMSFLRLSVSCLKEYSFRSRQSHRSSYVPIALAPLRIIEDPASFRVSSSAVFKGKEYTGLDCRIVSTRLGWLEKFGPNIEEETLALQTKRYRSLYPLHGMTYNLISGAEGFIKAKLLLQEALEGLPRGDGRRCRYALPDEDDKNYTTKQHYTGLNRMSQINHIQDGEVTTQHRMEGRDTQRQHFRRISG